MGMRRMLSTAPTWLFSKYKFCRFEDTSALNRDLTKCCPISKIAAATAELKVATQSRGKQGQCVAAIFSFSGQLGRTSRSAIQCWLFCWRLCKCTAGARADLAIFSAATYFATCACLRVPRELLQCNLKLRAVGAFRESSLEQAGAC